MDYVQKRVRSSRDQGKEEHVGVGSGKDTVWSAW